MPCLRQFWKPTESTLPTFAQGRSPRQAPATEPSPQNIVEPRAKKGRVAILKGNRMPDFSLIGRGKVLATVHQSLNREGYNFMPEEEVEARMTEREPQYNACEEPSVCAKLVLKAMPDIDAAVAVQVWAQKEGQYQSVVVTFFTRTGEESDGGATPIAQAVGLQEAASDATLKAIQEYEKEKEHPSPSLYQPSTNTPSSSATTSPI